MPGFKIDKTGIADYVRERASRPFPCPYSILLLSILDTPEFAELDGKEILASCAYLDGPSEALRQPKEPSHEP